MTETRDFAREYANAYRHAVNGTYAERHTALALTMPTVIHDAEAAGVPLDVIAIEADVRNWRR